MAIQFFPTGLHYAIDFVLPKINALNARNVVTKEELVEVFVRSLFDERFDADDMATGLFSNYVYTSGSHLYSVYLSIVEDTMKLSKDIRPALESLLALQYKVYGFTANDAKIVIRNRMGVSTYGAHIRSSYKYG